MEYPTTPAKRVLDLVDRYYKQLAAWRKTPETSSQYNDRGTLKYRRTWLEYREPHEEYSVTVAESQIIERYLVDTDFADDVIRAKAMEKALEDFA